MSDDRRFFTGSCHCGDTKYLVRIHPSASATRAEKEKIYRCNCTVCHKTGHFHIRPAAPPSDFYLLTGDPFTTLGNYHAKQERVSFFFCKNCAVRPFIHVGGGEMVDVDLDALDVKGVRNKDGEKTTKVWRPTPEVFYLSVNGNTIDAGQDGFDMRDYVDNKSLMYFNRLVDEKPIPDNEPTPYPGGCY